MVDLNLDLPNRSRVGSTAVYKAVPLVRSTGQGKKVETILQLCVHTAVLEYTTIHTRNKRDMEPSGTARACETCDGRCENGRRIPIEYGCHGRTTRTSLYSKVYILQYSSTV